MKILHSCLAAVGAAVLMAAPVSRAQVNSSNLYVTGGIGPSFVNDLTINAAGNAKNGVDPGYRITAAFGFKMNKYLAGEFETGPVGNWLDDSSGQPINAVANSAYLWQMPLLANLIGRLPLDNGITPYVGVGVGGVVSTMHMDAPNFRDYDSDIAFAYQFTLGVKFALNEHIDIGVNYKLLGTESQTWFGDSPLHTIHSSEVITHSVLATFTWNF